MKETVLTVAKAVYTDKVRGNLTSWKDCAIALKVRRQCLCFIPVPVRLMHSLCVNIDSMCYESLLTLCHSFSLLSPCQAGIDKPDEAWHVIAGPHFGSFVTYNTKNCIFFSIGPMKVLLFRH